MDKCREEFESWIIKSNTTGRVPNFTMKNENGAYIDLQTSDLWISWKASRESMKAIKLPEATFETPSGDNALREDAVIEAITSVGCEVE